TIEVKRTWADRQNRRDRSKMTPAGHWSDQNPTVRRAPDLMLANPLCCLSLIIAVGCVETARATPGMRNSVPCLRRAGHRMQFDQLKRGNLSRCTAPRYSDDGT